VADPLKFNSCFNQIGNKEALEDQVKKKKKK
jgi:hypothetical protein